MTQVLQFWLLLFAVNLMYFIPRFFLEFRHTRLIPILPLGKGTLSSTLKQLLIRHNYDLLRVSTDFFVFVIVYACFLRGFVSLQGYFVFLTIYVGLSLLYQVYYHIFHKVYHLDPVFFQDSLMLKTAGQIFIHDFSRKNLLILLAALFIGSITAVLIYYLLVTAQVVIFGPWSWLCILIVLAGGMYSIVQFSYAEYPMLTFQSQLSSFVGNIRRSIRSKKQTASLTLKYMKQYNVSPAVHLDEKPNLYFIVVESYGRMIFDEENMRRDFLPRLSDVNQRLQTYGWHAASRFTQSPVTGGASWISYTTLLYGLNIRNQGVYSAMLRNANMDEYDSLFHWLKRQGYITFRISGLGGYESMEIPYESYSRLYGVDHWVKYRDLDYSGEHYGFGPSPPDQFTLWCGDELCRKTAGAQPRATFFITQNSHTPYESPVAVSEDWKSLNTTTDTEKKPSMFWSRPKFENYVAAIAYQLDYLTDFISKKGSDNDIFVLVGDHQPPSLSRSVDNFDTPMHVISKNVGFIQQWQEYGFTERLIPNGEMQSLRQEALHRALLRTLISIFSHNPEHKPVFLPEGVPY